MRFLELLAPARNLDTGIAAIDCGADAVYIAGPDFGARKAAGNPVEDIAALSRYAHRVGARVFVTFNTLVYDDELPQAHAQMLQAQQAGADAFIIRDWRLMGWEDITVPFHASTQCAIRDPRRARRFEELGCSRIILERELSLEEVRDICSAVSCEVEFFVHGALCVCYSGECRLSEYLDSRSADRGECIQACRSLYDLSDASGRVLLRRKAILSLKDYRLKSRLEDLALAGVSSFKIEGRLKNISYVKNVVRDYDLALDALVSRYPDKFCRASLARVRGGFSPDTSKTFNRGYTQLFLDGVRQTGWSSMDAPKSMGEKIGTVSRLRIAGEGREMEFSVLPSGPGVELANGDGLCFVTPDGVTGFRADVCRGLRVSCKRVPDLRDSMTLYRNVSSAFEKTLEACRCVREVDVEVNARIRDGYSLETLAVSEDGRRVAGTFPLSDQKASNPSRSLGMIREQLSKRSLHYSFRLADLQICTSDGSVPFVSASVLNETRRSIAQELESLPFCAHPLYRAQVPARPDASAPSCPRTAERRWDEITLMRSRYCVRYELGLCPVRQGASSAGPLYLENNGRTLELRFDCRRCEMTVHTSNRLPSRVHCLATGPKETL